MPVWRRAGPARLSRLESTGMQSTMMGRTVRIASAVAAMIALAGCAEKEIAAGKHPEATALARHIAASQQREIDTMNRLLATR